MNKSEKFWNRAANTYDQSQKISEQTILRIIEKTKTYLKMSNVVFDFGCGTGLVSNEIADNVKAVQAMDTSSQMIAIARKKANERKIENIDYACSTIFDERYDSGAFDAVMAFYILHLSEDPHKVMQRISQLLKPDGLIVSATPCMGEKKTLQSILSLAGKIGLVPNIQSFKISELEDLIVRGNFEIIETECLRPSTQEYFIVGKKRQ